MLPEVQLIVSYRYILFHIEITLKGERSCGSRQHIMNLRLSIKRGMKSFFILPFHNLLASHLSRPSPLSLHSKSISKNKPKQALLLSANQKVHTPPSLTGILFLTTLATVRAPIHFLDTLIHVKVIIYICSFSYVFSYKFQGD
jgi:hypothetical protein